MLYFVGLGIEQSLTLRSSEELKKCEKVFYESYTSPNLREEITGELSEQLGPSKVEVVKREFV